MKTPGWTVTQSGRVVRPMKMRPERPLEPMRVAISELQSKSTGKKGSKVKKRVKPSPVRARRRTIDPTKWDSTYLTGMFLDAISVPSSSHTREYAPAGLDAIESGSDTDDDENVFEPGMEDNVPLSPKQTPSPMHLPTLSQPSGEPTCHEDPINIDIRRETTADLALLSNLFGESEDWGGSESVDDIQMDVSSHVGPAPDQVHNENDVEIVPRGYPLASSDSQKQAGEKGKEIAPPPQKSVSDGPGSGDDEDIEMVDAHSNTVQTAQSTSAAVPKLKDIFAPREEERKWFSDEPSHITTVCILTDRYSILFSPRTSRPRLGT